MAKKTCVGEGRFDLLEGSGSRVIEVEFGVFLKKLREWVDNTGIAADETPVEVGEAEELLEFFHSARCWPVQYGRYFVLRHADAGRGDDEAQELRLPCRELAFGRGAVEFVLNKALQHSADVGRVLFDFLGEDEDVVEIDEDNDVQHISEHVVHEVLKNGRRIS